MQAFKAAEDSLNAQYGSSIVTEFPFNGLGILEKVTRGGPKLSWLAMAATRVDSKCRVSCLLSSVTACFGR